MDVYITTKDAAEILGITPQTVRKITPPDKIVKENGISNLYLESKIYRIKVQRDLGTFKAPPIKKVEKKPCFVCGTLTGNRSQICKDHVHIFKVDDFYGVMDTPKVQDRSCPKCGRGGLLEEQYLCSVCTKSWNADADLDEYEAYGQVNL